MVKIIRFILLSFYCTIFSLSAQAQVKVEGIVFDKDTKQRIGRVMIKNKNTGNIVFNNLRGEFAVTLQEGEEIVVEKENYISDSLVYNGQQVLVLYLKRQAILIDPVTVVGRKSPEQILSERRRDYEKAYRLADPGDFISVGTNGAGLSIDAVYNYFSREGKNARRLTAYFQREYEDNIIDLRFSREIVRNVTGLEGEPLDNFMIRYRPTYEFVLQADYYEMVKYIKSKYNYFKYIPYIKPLPNLNELQPESKK